MRKGYAAEQRLTLFESAVFDTIDRICTHKDSNNDLLPSASGDKMEGFMQTSHCYTIIYRMDTRLSLQY